MGLAEERYMLFTTYRRDGRAVDTPVWVVGLADGQLGFYTTPDTGKVKRLAHTPRVSVQACDMRGSTTHGERHEGTATVVRGQQLEQIRTAIAAKYRIMSTLMGIAGALTRRGRSRDRVGIVVDLSASVG